MPKFSVTLKRDMADSESAVAIVEAATREDAINIALNDVDRDKLTWRRNNDFESETIVESISPAGENQEPSALLPADTFDPPDDWVSKEGLTWDANTGKWTAEANRCPHGFTFASDCAECNNET